MPPSAHGPLSVNYGPVGGTAADDLISRPPHGYRASEHRGRVGRGGDCFHRAADSLMTWGVQRGSGLRVIEVRQAPTSQMETSQATADGRHSGDGTLYIAPGTTIVLRMAVGPLAFRAPARVISVIDEPDRVGFTYGTLTGNPISGEESFVVERTDTGEVWFTLRQFSRPGGWFWRLTSPALRLAQRRGAARYLRALREASVP